MAHQEHEPEDRPDYFEEQRENNRVAALLFVLLIAVCAAANYFGI